MMRSIARLRRLEHAEATFQGRKPSVEEMQAEARGEPVRPVVAVLAAKMREYARQLDPWANANK